MNNDTFFLKTQNNSEYFGFPEYVPSPQFDKLINGYPKFKLFSQKINGLESIKIGQKIFDSLNFDQISYEAKICISKSIKKYGYIAFSRHIQNFRTLYIVSMLGVFLPQIAIQMKDIGFSGFKCFDIKRPPDFGCGGYWMIYL